MKRNAKGEGSFRNNPDGTVTHRKSVGYKTNGYRKVLTVTARNKSACIKLMKQKEDEWHRQQKECDVSSGMTVVDLCQKHLDYQVSQKELKPKSIDRRECTIANHIGKYPFGHMQVQAVSVADVDTHIGGLISSGKLSASSIEKVVDVLNAAFEWIIMRGEYTSNPVAPIRKTLKKRIQKLRQKSENASDVDVLSPEEERAFVEEARAIDERTGKPKYEAGLYGLFLLYTGMRCGEMLALRYSDIDAKGYITINKSRSMAKNRDSRAAEDKKYVVVEGSTKNEKARRLKLTEEAWAVLKEICERSYKGDPSALIVTTRTGKPNTASNLAHRIATIFRNAGLEGLSGGLHIFRRTFATRQYERGVRVKEIAAYIGDLESTTERYYISVRKKIREDGEVKQVVVLPDAGHSETDRAVS